MTYRLYPSAKQALALGALLRSHQQLYNAALEDRIDCYRKTGKSLSYAQQCASLTMLRRECPEWADAANCSSQQMTLRRLDKAFCGVLPPREGGPGAGLPALQEAGALPRLLDQGAR